MGTLMVRAVDKADAMLTLSSALQYRKPFAIFYIVQCESKKSLSTVFWIFFPNGWEFLINFLHTYYTIIFTLEYRNFYLNMSNFDKVMPY